MELGDTKEFFSPFESTRGGKRVQESFILVEARNWIKFKRVRTENLYLQSIISAKRMITISIPTRK